MNERFSQLLPWYVNGSIGAEDRLWMETWLRDHPEAAAELNWVRSLHQHVREDVPDVSDEIGLEKVMARVRAETTATAPARTERTGPVGSRMAAPGDRRGRPVSRSPGWLQALAQWLAPLHLSPALAAALVVVVVQAAFIGSVVLQPADETEIRAVQRRAIEQGPYLKVNFKGDAREADIRLLLVEIRGTFSAGPGQLGDYFVRVPAGRFEQAMATLQASPLVDAVSRVDGLPARE